jgi:hypothetical protein
MCPTYLFPRQLLNFHRRQKQRLPKKPLLSRRSLKKTWIQMPKGKNEMVEKLLKASSSSPRKHGKNVMCYRCGEKGHLAEICRKEATRFVCGAFGHRSFYCPRRGKQGNQVILFLVLQPYEDMVRNVEHLRKCAVSLRGRAFLSKASF